MIFQQILGACFLELPPSVQRLHLRSGTTLYAGEVQVERGRGVLSRLCAWATRLPSAGHGPLTVEIASSRTAERWTRRIGGHAMRSRLWASDGLLCERLGLVTFGFRLGVEHGQLFWRVQRVRALGVPLPARVFGAVVACESESLGRYTFDVRASLPGVGLLVHYRGWLHADPL